MPQKSIKDNEVSNFSSNDDWGNWKILDVHIAIVQYPHLTYLWYIIEGFLVYLLKSSSTASVFIVRIMLAHTQIVHSAKREKYETLEYADVHIQFSTPDYTLQLKFLISRREKHLPQSYRKMQVEDSAEFL